MFIQMMIDILLEPEVFFPLLIFIVTLIIIKFG